MGENISIEVIFGGKKHPVQFLLFPDSTILDLMKVIEKVVHVPFNKQRLIYKGRSITDPDSLMFSYNIQEGSKLMITKLDPDEVAKLNQSKELSELVNTQLTELELKSKKCPDITESDIKKHVKCTIDIMERCMRSLELLDSVCLPYDAEKERLTRKKLVDLFQVNLMQADKLKTDFLHLKNVNDCL